MIFGIADDGYADAEAGGDGALGDGVGGVVGALGVNVGTQFFEQFFDVRFGENHDVVHDPEGGDEKGAGLFVENGAARAFQRASAGVGVDGDDEKVALLFCAGEVANMADVEGVEAAVGENDALAALLRGCQQSD